MKPATAKAKGRETENLAVRWLRQFEPRTERRRLQGVEDQGDIAGIDGVCIEVKSGARLALTQWLRELAAEIVHSGAETGAVLVRPKGKPDPADWFIVMPTGLWAELMTDAGLFPNRTEVDQ